MPKRIELERQEREVHSILSELRVHEASRIGLGSWTGQSLEDSLQKDMVWVQEVDGRVAAFLVARPLLDGYEILLLGTSPDYQRKGVMESLLRSWLSEIAPGQKIWLEVHENNLAARNLYEKCGFKVSGRRPRYYPDGGAAMMLEYIA